MVIHETGSYNDGGVTIEINGGVEGLGDWYKQPGQPGKSGQKYMNGVEV